MRIALVSMPWHLLATPSLPLGILQAVTAQRENGHEVRPYFGNLNWAEHLHRASRGTITPQDYDYIANIGVWHGIGDWIFTSAYYGTPGWRLDRYRAHLAEHGVDPGKSEAMAELAADYIDAQAAEIVTAGPDLVGFSSTFQQNMPSLALARKIKELAPGIPILFGGGNCDVPMGPALHRNFPSVDYVISGEAEDSYLQLLDHLAGALPVEKVGGLSWRTESGTTVTNPPGPLPSMSDTPCPEFEAYFAELERSPISSHVKPTLLYEAARGCWWGEKHHCTFCGLNGLTMKFRARPPEQVAGHLRSLVRRHRILDIVTVDNILDMNYLRTLLPKLAAADLDLNFYYEVKSNLGDEEVALLRAAGLVHVQPGIENLSTAVLKIMNKGVHGTQNVRLLRICEEQDVTVDWNYLYGFPGEQEEHYTAILDQFPALVHLQPPAGSARILLERYSPYFQRPELGFLQRRPASWYDHVYDLPEDELHELAYQFDTPPAGIGEVPVKRLNTAIEVWQDNYPVSSLTCRREGGSLVIADRRAGWPARDIRLDAGAMSAAYGILRSARTRRGLAERLAAQGHQVEATVLSAWLDDWKSTGLVFEDCDRLVALAANRPSLKRRPSHHPDETPGA
jgi:ribosomal peptide maturation radical SAM protein 1